MAIRDAMILELEREAEITRRLLERVPEEKLGWKPAEKSMSLNQLASHLANLPHWGLQALSSDELDINPPDGEPMVPPSPKGVAAIVEMFDLNVARLRDAISSTDDAAFAKTWTLKSAGAEVFSQPKAGVLRGMVLNHIIHHRGQLTVYLRLNDVPLPMTYGPSADETGGFQ
ncbi:MAG: hypothetical protein AMS21_03020 [Gemmatimonas sp. SG8_38_2]|nr:MAG: hypothetical protein AMS21_03020 [Gemmatimonas sp. SG8_38_2]